MSSRAAAPARRPPGSAAPPRRRTRARRGEGERLREEILAAAERLLIASGDEEAVSIRAVAEAVGVTPPSIYLHFADKNELLFTVCERTFHELARLIEEAATADVDPLESLRRRGRAYVHFGIDNPEQYRILFMCKEESTPTEVVAERLRRSAAFDHLVESVRRCMEAGLMVPAEPTLVSLGLWAAVHGLTSLLITKPNFPWPDVDTLVDHVLAVQVRGLAAKPGATARRR